MIIGLVKVMAFVDIPTLNGGTVHVNAASVFRVTRGIADAAALTRVDFGTEHQLTQIGIREVAQSLEGAGAKLAEFAAPDATPHLPERRGDQRGSAR